MVAAKASFALRVALGLERIVYVPQIPDVHITLQPKVQERAHMGRRPVAAAAGVEQRMPLPGGAGS